MFLTKKLLKIAKKSFSIIFIDKIKYKIKVIIK